jgi:anti-repressor protein
MELIKIEVNQNMDQVVSARELHEVLGIKERFSAWFQRVENSASLIEDVDYCRCAYTNANNQTFEDYHVTLEIAKHLVMVSGGEKAKEVRQYFIEVEKAWNNPEQVMARALQVSNKVLLEYKQKLELIQPKAEFYDAVVGSTETIDMGQVAKVLNMGIGRNQLFEILRSEYVLMSNNEPYQSYIDKGWFRLVESKYQMPNGDTRINIKTVVFQKGVDGIRKLLSKIL